MKRTDGNADKGESGGSGSTFFEKNKKRNLLGGGGGGGLSLEALALGKNKPFVTASQICEFDLSLFLRWGFRNLSRESLSQLGKIPH
jgi:hypothetical protein